MGGIGTYIEIEPIDPPPGKKRSTPRALHTTIGKAILDRVWKRCGHGAFRSTAGEYLYDEKAGSKRNDLWSARDNQLSWAFMDHAGCCSGSSRACSHWFDVCLAGYRDRWDKMAANRGHHITTRARSSMAALCGNPYPLVAHGEQPLCVPGFPPGQLDWEDAWSGPFWNDGDPRPVLADFDEKSRQASVHAALTGMCTCGVCRALRPWSGREQSPVAPLERAWLALAESDERRALAAEVRAEVAAHADWATRPEGPPALVRLSEQLGEPPLPWELAGMCFRLRG